MRKNTGASLTQYVIILSLIILACVAIFANLGNLIVKCFESYYYDMIKMNNEVALNTSVNNTGGIKAGQLGGTPSNPIKQCSGNTCSIDYGSFALNGVPANFNTFVETSGAAGGTDTLVNELKQIADQLDDPNTSADEGADFRVLANLGHYLAQHQKIVEDVATGCKTDANPKECFSNGFDTAAVPPAPADLAQYFNDGYNDGTYNNFLWGRLTPLGATRNNMVYDGNIDPKGSINTAIIAAYDRLMSNESYPAEARGVADELFKNIDDISFNMFAMTEVIRDEVSMANDPFHFDPASLPTTGHYPRWDIKTGVIFPEEVTFNFADLSMTSITHPATSTNTNLDSALICAAGWNKDTGSNCHQY